MFLATVLHVFSSQTEASRFFHNSLVHVAVFTFQVAIRHVSRLLAIVIINSYQCV